MFKKLWQFILGFLAAWREQERRYAEAEAKYKAAVRESVEKAESLTKSDKQKRETVKKRIKTAQKRTKDLGLILLLSIAIPAALPAQSAEERIRTLAHEDLKVYAQELVDLSREQASIIIEQQADIDELERRMDLIQPELERVRAGVEKLTNTRSSSGTVRVVNWILRIVPAVFAGIAAVK